MEGNTEGSTGRNEAREPVAWLDRNRDEIARQTAVQLVVTGVLAGLGLLLAGLTLFFASPSTSIPLWIVGILGPAVLALGGALGFFYSRRRHRPPAYLVKAAQDGERLKAYFEQVRSVLEQGLGDDLEDPEQQLLVVPAQIMGDMLGFPVQLALLEPVRPDKGKPSWQVRYQAGFSERECRDFEVPLKESFIAWMQPRWKPDEVFEVTDLPEEVAKTFAPGIDMVAFDRAGYRVLKCVRSETPSTEADVTSCLIFLSRDPLINGTEDAYLMMLSRLITSHFERKGTEELDRPVKGRRSDLRP